MFCWSIYSCTIYTLQNVHEDSPIAADCPSSSNLDALPGPSSNQNGSHAPFSSHKTDEEESDTSEDEIIPVVVRPGHIRFEPAGMVLHSPFYVNPSLCITGQAVSREHDYVSICATLTCIFVSSLKHKCCWPILLSLVKPVGLVVL